MEKTVAIEQFPVIIFRRNTPNSVFTIGIIRCILYTLYSKREEIG